MKKTFILLLLSWLTSYAFAQVQVLQPYKPATSSPQPVTPPQPITYSTSPTTPVAPAKETPSEAEARRAAALAKVQNRQAPAPSTMSAKGLRPSEYSTDPQPVQYSAPDPATTMTVNGQNVQRNVRKGAGQVGNEMFTPVSQLHFVQFAVYCKDTPVDKAPSIPGLFLLWHAGSTCPGGDKGAAYIVRGYNSAEEAKAAVLAFKAQHIDCWYNPALTGAEVEIIGVR